MSELKKDQNDVLAQLEQLTADLGTAKQAIVALETGKGDLEAKLKEANERIAKLTADNAALITERDTFKAENVRLTTDMADFNKRVAAEITKHGIRGTIQTATAQPENKKSTYTEQLLTQRGVKSLEELAAQRKPTSK